MQRDVLARIFEWNNKAKRKPLVLMGARQVGKTWLMKEFGRTSFANTAYINFDNNRRIAKTESVERASVPLASDVVYMRIRADFRPGQDWAELDWSLDGKSWHRIGPRVGMHFDWQRFFVGTRFALFCYSAAPSGGSVDIDGFRLTRGGDDAARTGRGGRPQGAHGVRRRARDDAVSVARAFRRVGTLRAAGG